MDSKTLKTRIASIKTRSKKLDSDIHDVAVGCLEHAQEHGNFTPCGDLVNAMGRSARREDIKAWFAFFGPVKFERDSNKATKRKTTDEQYRPFDVEKARKTPFWELIQDKPPEPVAYTDIIGKLWAGIKRAEKAREEGLFVGDFERVETLKAQLASLTGVKGEEELAAMREADKNLKDEFKKAPGTDVTEPAH